ncbi:hypothetical protein [Roseococcus sp.]
MARPPRDDSDLLPGCNLPISAIVWLTYAAVLAGCVMAATR